MQAVFSGLCGHEPSELFSDLTTPCYILDEKKLRHNGEILAGVAKRTGCKILLAQKAFSNWNLYPLLSEYLVGTEASGLFEARLGAEEMPDKEVHVFSTAYRDDQFDEILCYADHVVFNSPEQLKKFGKKAKEHKKSIGLRINPECSTQEDHAIYDPCADGSRLGTTREQWEKKMQPEWISLLDGLHFHTLCEQNADALEETLRAVQSKFSDVLPHMKWLNMGGGHHITRKDYDLPLLERIISDVQKRWGVEVYLEPGEAVALNAGYLATRVLDITENANTKNVILDVSAACHMPDVLEMPYKPPLYGSNNQGCGYKYSFGGPTCLSGDVIGEYFLASPLKEGDMLLFGDMAIYTTCKNNTFNGMALPSIVLWCEDGSFKTLRSFDYEDFKTRLGDK